MRNSTLTFQKKKKIELAFDVGLHVSQTQFFFLKKKNTFSTQVNVNINKY